jgi:hypothetical protein
MKLHNFTTEIMDIADKNGVTWDVGKDMFMANIINEGDADRPKYYAGADHVKYAELKAHYDELAKSSVDFVAAYQANYTEISRMWREGDRMGITELMKTL